MLSHLRRSALAALAAWVACAGTVHATGIIRITEAMSSSGDNGGTRDWFELTNYGTTAVDIGGWRMDDDSFSFGASVALTPFSFTLGAPAWTTINPGESVVFVETNSPATVLESFRTFWNLGDAEGNRANPKMGSYTGSGVGLSSGADGVSIFNATGQEITSVRFGAATTGVSFYYSYDANGALATSANGTLSQDGRGGAYQSGGIGNIASPGTAIVASDVGPPLYWTANGTALGGSGTWNASGAQWSAAAAPVTSGAWSDGQTAIFDGPAGTVTVASDVAPLGITFATSGYTLAAGPGSVATPLISVTTGSATVTARLTGPEGLGIGGGGTLIFAGIGNDYAGTTSVIEGIGRSGADHVIPDGSRLSVARFQTYDFAGHADTVAGLVGLGSITNIGQLTVNVEGASDAIFNGFLRGSGSLIIDSAGTGRQVLDTTGQTNTQDFAVKDYSGATVIRRGTLAVDRTAIPNATSGVSIEAAGRLELSSNSYDYLFGTSAATVVRLEGGSIGQEAGEDAGLLNAVEVVADSAIAIRNDVTPNPLNRTTEVVRLGGPLSGAAARTLALTVSNTTPGADLGRVDFQAAGSNSFAGTIAAGVNMNARFQGDYAAAAVTMEGGVIDGTGAVRSIAGTGTVSPGVPDFGAGVGILTAESLTAAGLGFRFEFQTANADPVWFAPTLSENDVLRLTAATPFTGGSLTAANTVNLLFDVDAVAETDTFRGGFFTTTDQTAAIGGATVAAFIRGDGQGTDLTVSGVSYYSLAAWNTLTNTTVSPLISMVAVEADFDFSPTQGYVMQVAFGEPTPPTVIVIDVPSGTVSQADAGHPLLSGTTPVRKTGGGTLVLSASNTLSATVTVAEGTVQLAADALPAATVEVAAGGTLTLAPHVQATVAGIVLEGGLVDVGTGRITVTAGMSAATLVSAIAEGRDGGVDGQWTSASGISSSAAATEAASGQPRGIGWLDNGDGSFTFAFAAPGDTNLDGLIDIQDAMNFLAGNKFDTNLFSAWIEGDFNYDGFVDVQDAIEFLSTGLYDLGPYNEPPEPSGFSLKASGRAGDGTVLDVVSVPEPSGLVLLLAFAAAGACWRRRQ